MLTKQERLAAAASKGDRTTGGLAERRELRGAISRAMEKVSGIPSDTEMSTEDARAVRELLRQRYPGRKLSDLIARGEQIEQDFLRDPVQARDALIAGYALMPAENLPTYKAPKQADGLRGSIQRAQQDQADAEDLAAASGKYGKGLNQILAQLEAFDRGMIENPGYMSARLATAYGAPATEGQIPAYQTAQAQKQAQAAHEQRWNQIHEGVCAAIQHGHIPSDPATLNEMAAIMALPQFQHDQNGLNTLKRAAAIALHPEHKRITGKTGKSGATPRGSRSISGGSPNASHDSTRSSIRPASGVRASIERAMAR